MPAEHDDFDELLKRVQQGDAAALESLVEHYEYEVRLAARSLLGPALRPYLDSIDLTQSVHFALLDGMQRDKLQIGSPEHLVALAVTIVRRKVARHWRRLKHQQRMENWQGDDRDVDTLLESLLDREDDPARAAQVAEEVETILSGLSGDQRRLIELRLQGYSTADAARLMGVDADVLRVRLSRLRKDLQHKLPSLEWL